MVLAELGTKIKGALSKLRDSTLIDEDALDSVLKEICFALLQSDVNARIVGSIRKNIKSKVNLEELAKGTKGRICVSSSLNELYILQQNMIFVVRVCFAAALAAEWQLVHRLELEEVAR